MPTFGIAMVKQIKFNKTKHKFEKAKLSQFTVVYFYKIESVMSTPLMSSHMSAYSLTRDRAAQNQASNATWYPQSQGACALSTQTCDAIIGVRSQETYTQSLNPYQVHSTGLQLGMFQGVGPLTHMNDLEGVGPLNTNEAQLYNQPPTVGYLPPPPPLWRAPHVRSGKSPTSPTTAQGPLI